MRWSEENGSVAKALVAFQSEAKNPPKDKTADMEKYKYTYAALPDIIDLVRPLLAKHGLAVIQSVGTEEGMVAVSTTIVHESGEWMESESFRLPMGPTPQSAGGSVTYARRYSLTAALGLAADEDDDAQRVSYMPSVRPAPEPAVPKTKDEIFAERGTHNDLGEQFVTPEAMEMMATAAKAANMDGTKTLELATASFGVGRLYDLTLEQAGDLVLTMQDMVNG